MIEIRNLEKTYAGRSFEVKALRGAKGEAGRGWKDGVQRGRYPGVQQQVPAPESDAERHPDDGDGDEIH